MTMIGTHQNHCCLIHGCKYGSSVCPVAMGWVAQTYPCEQDTSEDRAAIEGIDWMHVSRVDPKVFQNASRERREQAEDRESQAIIETVSMDLPQPKSADAGAQRLLDAIFGARSPQEELDEMTKHVKADWLAANNVNEDIFDGWLQQIKNQAAIDALQRIGVQTAATIQGFITEYEEHS